MITVGSYEAKTHLPALLEKVAKGEKILITRRGIPLAMLVPPPMESKRNVKQIVKEMLEFRDQNGPVLGKGLTIRQLIEEGRRF